MKKYVIVIIVILILLISLFLFSNKDNSNYNYDIDINCSIDDIDYNITLSSNNKFICNKCSDIINKDIKDIINYDNLDESSENIEKYFIDNGGICYR